MQVILLNGPPRSGKDTAANALLAATPNSTIMRFSGPLKAATHAAFGLRASLDTEGYKDAPREEFDGLTPREAYIAMSEVGIKPAFGALHFGKVLARRILSSDASMVVVPDSGFAYEAEPVVAAVGAANVLLLRLHRPGRTFDGDSRSHISLKGVRTIDVQNIEDADYLGRLVTHIVRDWAAPPTPIPPGQRWLPWSFDGWKGKDMIDMLFTDNSVKCGMKPLDAMAFRNAKAWRVTLDMVGG